MTINKCEACGTIVKPGKFCETCGMRNQQGEQPPLKKTYWVLWTYSANYGGPAKVEEKSVLDAVMMTFGYVFNLVVHGAKNCKKNREKITFHVFSTDGHEYSGNFNRLEMLSCERCNKLCKEGDLSHDEETEMAVCGNC